MRIQGRRVKFQKTGGLFKKTRGRRGIGLLWSSDLRSTRRIRSAGGRASARRPERLTGGAGRAARGGGLTGGPGRQRGRGRLTGGPGGQSGRGGSGLGPLDLRWAARLGLGLFKSGSPDLGWTAGIGWPALSSPTASRGGGARSRGGELARDEGRGGSAGPWGDRSGLGGWGRRGESSGGG